MKAADVKAADVKAYVDRDWSSVRRLKDRYWAERRPQLTVEQALGIADYGVLVWDF